MRRLRKKSRQIKLIFLVTHDGFHYPHVPELMILSSRVHTVLLRVATLEAFDWDVDVLVPP